MIQATGENKKISLQQKSAHSKGVAQGARVTSSGETLESSQTERSPFTRGSQNRKSIWGRFFSKKKPTPMIAPVITREQHVFNLTALLAFVTHADNVAFVQATGLFREIPSPSKKEIASRDLSLFLQQNHGSDVPDIHILTATLIKDSFRSSVTQKEKLLLALATGIKPASLKAAISPECQEILDEILQELNIGVVTTSPSSALRVMVKICQSIEKYSESNKMDFYNLAVCIAPILYPQTTETSEGVSVLITMTTLMKQYFESLLQGTDIAPSVQLSPELQSLRQAIIDSVNAVEATSELRIKMSEQQEEGNEALEVIESTQEDDIQPYASIGDATSSAMGVAERLTVILDPNDPEGIYASIGEFNNTSESSAIVVEGTSDELIIATVEDASESRVSLAQRDLPPIPLGAAWHASLSRQPSLLSRSASAPADDLASLYAEVYAEVAETAAASSSESLSSEEASPIFPIAMSITKSVEILSCESDISDESSSSDSFEAAPLAPPRTLSLTEPVYDSPHDENERSFSPSFSPFTDLSEAFFTSSPPSSPTAEAKMLPVPRPRTFSLQTSTLAISVASSSELPVKMMPPIMLPPKAMPRIQSLSFLKDESPRFSTVTVLGSTESLSDVLEWVAPDLPKLTKPQPKPRKKTPPPVRPRVSSLPTTKAKPTASDS